MILQDLLKKRQNPCPLPLAFRDWISWTNRLKPGSTPTSRRHDTRSPTSFPYCYRYALAEPEREAFRTRRMVFPMESLGLASVAEWSAVLAAAACAPRTSGARRPHRAECYRDRRQLLHRLRPN